MILDENESSCMAALTRAGTSLVIRGSGMVRAGRVWGTARRLKSSRHAKRKDRAQLGLFFDPTSSASEPYFRIAFWTRTPISCYPGTGNLAQPDCPSCV